MKNKKILLMGLTLVGLLASCGGGNQNNSEQASNDVTSNSDGVSAGNENSSIDNLEEKVELKMSIQYQKSDTRMEFDSSIKGYQDIEGNTYLAGDLKPVWKEVSQRLNITINDVTPADKVNDSFTNWITTGLDKVDVLQGGASQIQNQATMNAGSILDLSKYLNYLPNFRDFLDSNEVVKKTITTSTGSIYYAPYFDGYDDAEKMVLMRTDWVKKLLDTENGSYDTATTINTSYTAYMPDSLDTEVSVLRNGEKATLTKKYSSGKGIIARMNALTTKNGQTLVETLKAYIKDTYGNQYDKLSDLFVGEDAAYDADEYVALLRCIKANPQFLTGKNDPVVPLYPRESKNSRTADLFSFMGQLFGIRGLSSRSGYLYINSNGVVRDARWEQGTVDALERFNQMYNEGLILANFNDSTSAGGTAGKYVEDLHSKNLGFSTFDYCQTQTAYNNNYRDTFEGYCFQPVIAPLARWNGSEKYTRFQESWRSVKTEGWCLSGNLEKAGNEKKLARALTLFDYFWSEEGNRLMSYGPDQYLERNSDGTIATIEYNGKQVPKLNDKTIEQLATLTKYNYTNYYRKYLGATFPIGYVKEQGMEYQCNVTEGREGLDIVSKAIAKGVIEHPDVTWTNADKWYWICPTTFALDADESSAITTQYTKLDEITNDSSKSNIWAKYVMYGFGGTDGTTTLKTKDEYITYYKDECFGSKYLNIYANAFNRMHD